MCISRHLFTVLLPNVRQLLLSSSCSCLSICVCFDVLLRYWSLNEFYPSRNFLLLFAVPSPFEPRKMLHRTSPNHRRYIYIMLCFCKSSCLFITLCSGRMRHIPYAFAWLLKLWLSHLCHMFLMYLVPHSHDHPTFPSSSSLSFASIHLLPLPLPHSCLLPSAQRHADFSYPPFTPGRSTSLSHHLYATVSHLAFNDSHRWRIPRPLIKSPCKTIYRRALSKIPSRQSSQSPPLCPSLNL